jgi:hypothetical protein
MIWIVLQIAFIALWYVVPTLPVWLVFLPAIVWGLFTIIGLMVIVCIALGYKDRK